MSVIGKGEGAEDNRTGKRWTYVTPAAAGNPPEDPEQWPQALFLHTPYWLLSGPLMRLGGQATPFFITDTQMGRAQPRTLASQSEPSSVVYKHLPSSISKRGRCWRSGHGQLDNLIKPSWGRADPRIDPA